MKTKQKTFKSQSAKSQNIDTKKEFVVVVPFKPYTKKGDTLKLVVDDGSICPLFKNLSEPDSKITFYEDWTHLYYAEEDKEEESPLIELLNQYLDLQKKNKDWEIEITISAKRK